MKRCTEWRNGHGAIVDNSVNYIDRLAQYEDSGLAPENIVCFADRERELLSLGLLRLIHEADRAMGVIHSEAAQTALKAYRDELQALNLKVLEMEA